MVRWPMTNLDLREGSCDRTYLSQQSNKKINLGKYGPVYLVFFALTSLWRRRCNLFSDKQIEQMR
jgi:hypothetical protein